MRTRIKHKCLFYALSKLLLPCFFLSFISTILLAQAPANDNCSNANVINITNGGFGIGTFTSAKINIAAATTQTGETFAPAIFSAGLDQKSVWFKFTLPVKRLVNVTMLEPGSAIQAGDAGFAVYKTTNCPPGNADLSDKFTPIAKFGTSAFPCADSGVYLIQVSSKKTANGEVFIQLYLSDSTGGTVSTPVYADYDHPKNAYDFGKLTANTSHVDFDVSCQTIEDATEVCSSLANYKQYTKSTWQTFTTPAYFDYLAVLLGAPNCNFKKGQTVIGYRLYKGDAKTKPLASLTPIGNCDSLVTDGYYSAFKMYRCDQLDANTTYTVQLLYRYDFDDNVRLAVTWDGTKPTQAPEPIIAKIPASNQLGTLPEGYTTAVDYFGCNSRHSLHPCGFALPAKGVKVNGVNYNLSTFYTFKLSSSANINVYGYAYAPYFQNIIRIYKQTPNANCATLDSAHLLIQSTTNTAILNCLDAGTYTLQVLGTDSLVRDYTYCSSLAGSSPLYMLSHLGKEMDLRITVDYVNPLNKYSLKANGAYDQINYSAGKLQPLKNNVVYNGLTDTFGCSNTVLPPTATGNYCGFTPNPDKAIYREFNIGDANGDNKADSGVITLSSIYGYNGSYMTHILYKGDANALALAQNKHAYGDSITGLVPYTQCMYSTQCGGSKICITPGTYTLVTLGNDNHVGTAPYDPSFQFNIVSTKHYNGITAQNMGSIIDTIGSTNGTINSDIDYFSCTDNAVTIDGFAPPVLGSDTSTKAIYRQFYLSKASIANICQPYYGDCNQYYYGSGAMALFSGKATDGLNKLKKLDWQFCQSATCNPLSAGWYTLVCYGAGATYKNPFHNTGDGYGGAVGKYSRFSINIQPGCPGPMYNRPYKASVDTITKQPYLFEWKNRVANTAAYPVTDTTYILNTENFNCTIDAPFPSYIKACDPSVNRVAYYVFKITQESYVQINTNNLWAEVFDKDVRKDSSKFSSTTPLQPCIQSYGDIQICRMQPGTYTLVIFAGDSYVSNGCATVTPTVYIDKVGYSRFDHAENAYDFGVIPPDSVYHNGKTGDVNPLNSGRAPSNDFFYCTTGSQRNDPIDAACGVDTIPGIYKAGVNNVLYTVASPYGNIPRRNLWYTFVVNQGGYIHVKVENKTPDKQYQYPFAVYKSDVDPSLPFSSVVNSGQVDSTIAQGLTYVAQNPSYYYCSSRPKEISIYRPPCSATPERYYILVDNSNSYPYEYPGMKPNSQVEVSVLMDSVNVIKPKFDHYYLTDTIGLNLGAGTYRGHADNFMCATPDVTDPTYYSCAPKTLWYKFTVTTTGHIKYRGVKKNGESIYGYDQVELFHEQIKGDSTKKGLVPEVLYPGTAYGHDDEHNLTTYYNTQCISPGTYYLLFTGCNQPEGDLEIYPEIQLEEEAGDFCSAPVVASLKGPGNDTSSVTVDCHTIGTDYGEFAPTLTCPAGAKTTDYKSSWFRIDIGGKDTLDVTTYLVENTNAGSADIKYRLMTGDCGAMQEQSCVQDALTQNTYRCLIPGSYYIQVFTPVIYNGAPVTGTIDLHVLAVPHADTCKPDKNCLATARFTSQFDCTTDTAVQFINYSTYGSSIQYKWDFGYKNDTSAEVSPTFFYPALSTDKTYKVKLLTQNISCDKSDSFTLNVTVPARPYVNLGDDIKICSHDSTVTLKATSFPGAVYQWQSGTTDSILQVKAFGNNRYSVSVSYKNCISVDTIYVFINPVTKSALQDVIICNVDSVHLQDDKGSFYYDNAYQYVNYQWNTGATDNNIYAKTPGLYWVDYSLNSCNARDSFNVTTTNNLHPLGRDTSACFSNGGITLDATVQGATSYLWQDGAASGPQYTISAAGKYWVAVTIGSCTVNDTITVADAAPPLPLIKGTPQFCAGDSTVLDAGRGYEKYVWNTGDTTETIHVKTAADYNVQVYQANGCSALSSTVTVAENSKPTVSLSGGSSICFGDSTILDAGTGFPKYLWSTGDTTQTIYVKKAGEYLIQVTDNNNCHATDSTLVNISGPAVLKTIDASSCNSNGYVLPSGKTVNVSGVYKDTLQSTAGCDSLITTVNLTLLKAVQVDTSITGCGLLTYTLPSGKSVNSTGFYKDTVRTISGCDSIITHLNFTITAATVVDMNASVCNGQYYTLPSGQQVNVSGIYKDTVKTAAGCDSLITNINLSLGKPIIVNKTSSICAGGSYTLPSGITVTEAGMYNDTVRSAKGCDSLITALDLSIINPVAAGITTSVCSGSSYTLPSGLSINQTGSYQDTIRNITGCDSLITTVNLTVINPSANVINASVCSGHSYTFPSGIQVTAGGTYQDTLRSGKGCDSLITTIHLSVQSATASSINASICEGTVYTLPSGIQVSTAGNYNDTIRTINGCDSLITAVHLATLSVANTSLNVSICGGQPYTLPSGTTVNASGIYKDTLRSASGCDSLITTVNLTLNKAATQSINAVICNGQVYTFPSGYTVNRAGNYADTLKGISGCDSIITLVNLSVNSPLTKNITASVCKGQSYQLPSGTLVNTPGVYRDTIRTTAGCDSLVTQVLLSITEPTFIHTDAYVCVGSIYTLPSGKNVIGAGIYQDTIHSKAGCDSIVTKVNLTVSKAVFSNKNLALCAGQSYQLPSGLTITTAGVYKDTLQNAAGCDSIITTTTVTVTTPQLVNSYASFCEGKTYTLPWGTIINSGGIYRDTVKNNNGCDSLIYVANVTVSKAAVANKNISLCEGLTYTLPSGIIVTTSGTYKDTLFASSGCDSLITSLHIIFTPKPDISISKSNDVDCVLGTATLTASGGSQYVWSPAFSLNNPYVYNPVAAPAATTYYHVQVTNNNGCVATDSIEVKVIVGEAANGFKLPSAFTPNADGLNDCFGVKSWGLITDLSFLIYDRWGKLLFHTTDAGKCWDGTFNGVILPSAAYVYYISANTNCGRVNRKGTVVLIR